MKKIKLRKRKRTLYYEYLPYIPYKYYSDELKKTLAIGLRKSTKDQIKGLLDGTN